MQAEEGSDGRSLWTSRLSRAFLDALRKELDANGSRRFSGSSQRLQMIVGSMRYQKNKFASEPEQMAKVYTRLQAAFDKYGYPSPMDEAELEVSSKPDVSANQ